MKETLNTVDTVQRALFRPPSKHQPCSPTCTVCRHIWYSENIKDQQGTSYRLQSFDCRTHRAIYLIHCLQCNKDYVGMTSQSIRSRLSNHISSIKNHKDTSVARHFNSPDHCIDHLAIGILDSKNINTNELKFREGAWIYLLNTIYEGINQRDEANVQLDHQVLLLHSHYRHSTTCLPYMISSLSAQRLDMLQHAK